MSAFSDVRRAEIAVRAHHQCEYCRLPTRGQVATFPIDHIIPRSAGGTTEPGNLALTCPHCNAAKWTAVTAHDPISCEVVPLVHPRRDLWDEHFAWSAERRGDIVGITPIGRATINA